MTWFSSEGDGFPVRVTSRASWFCIFVETFCSELVLCCLFCFSVCFFFSVETFCSEDLAVPPGSLFPLRNCRLPSMSRKACFGLSFRKLSRDLDLAESRFCGSVEEPRDNLAVKAGSVEEPRDDLAVKAGSVEEPRDDLAVEAGSVVEPRDDLAVKAGSVVEPRDDLAQSRFCCSAEEPRDDLAFQTGSVVSVEFSLNDFATHGRSAFPLRNILFMASFSRNLALRFR